MFPHVFSNGCRRFERIASSSAAHIDIHCSKDAFEPKDVLLTFWKLLKGGIIPGCAY